MVINAIERELDKIKKMNERSEINKRIDILILAMQSSKEVMYDV